jgi:hypothetical protein
MRLTSLKTEMRRSAVAGGQNSLNNKNIGSGMKRDEVTEVPPDRQNNTFKKKEKKRNWRWQTE